MAPHIFFLTATPSVILANHHFITGDEQRVLYSQCWQLLLAAQTHFCSTGKAFRAGEANKAPTFQPGGGVFTLCIPLCVCVCVVGLLTSLSFGLRPTVDLVTDRQ